MVNKIKISSKFLTVNGQRCGIWFSVGPWVEGVNPDTIKIRAKRGYFGQAVRDAITIENNSDMREDYFEGDSIRLVPGHPLYDMAARAAGVAK